MVKKNYYVVCKARKKNSGYETLVVKPYSGEYKWSKARATKEMKYAEKNITNSKTGLKLGETHKCKVY